MAKLIASNTPETEYSRYRHFNGQEYSYPESGRVVPVGNVAALHAAMAFGTLQAGDTILITEPGIYSLNSTLIQHEANVHITADTTDPTEVIIRGRGMDNPIIGDVWHGVYSQMPGLKISNLTMDQFYYHAVTFGAGATDPEFNNVRFLDMGQQFIKASAFPAAINNGKVYNCEFAYTAGRPTTDHDGAGYFYGGFIDVHNGANWHVRGCVAREILPTAAEIAALPPGATQHWWSPAFYFWNGSSNTLIENSVFINCGRAAAFGLILRGGGINDHTGGIMRNNMAVITPGRIGQAQIDDSDGVFLAWDSPGANLLHNTILTYGQIADAIQGRWSTGLVISNNLSNDSIRMRDSAVYSGNGGLLTAQPNWFVNPTTGNLRLNSTGNANVGLVSRLANCPNDIDGFSRPVSTKYGAHHYV